MEVITNIILIHSVSHWILTYNQEVMTMKRIVYYVGYEGIEGKDKLRITFASFDEKEVIEHIEKDVNKNWLHKGEKIIDVEYETKQALAKIDGIGKLLLGIEKD